MNNISDLIKILNVRTASVGIRRHDVMKLPISSSSDDKLDKLLTYADFFKLWRESRKSGLTNETSTAIENLCRNMQSLIVHLLDDLGFQFVLTGQITSDCLESRFGRYRKMSGSNYYISVKQLIENERKIKLVSLLKHSRISIDSLTLDETVEEDYTTSFDIELCEEDKKALTISDAELQVVYYVSGYCGHRVKKTISCTDCVSMFVSNNTMPNTEQSSEFFNFINRGKLDAPSDQLFSFLCDAYSLFCCLKSNSCHFHAFLRRQSPVNDFISLVEKHVSFGTRNKPPCGNDIYKLWQRCVRSFFNCLARNMIRSMSNQTDQGASRKIHKLRSRKM